MLQRHDGYILFSVLLFIIIATILSVSSLASIQSTFKLRHTAFTRTEEVFATRRVLETLMKQRQLHCDVPVTLPKRLAQQSLLWWWQHACREVIQGRQYFYVIENLGSDACALIEGKAAAYYRLTLYHASEFSPVVLQATFAEPEIITDTCTGQAHLVTPGMQRWREL